MAVSVTCEQARYLFGVVPDHCPSTLGCIGFGAGTVYTVRSEGLAAVVQDCPSHWPDAAGTDQLEEHLRVHQRVLETAMHQAGAVLPVRYGTVLAAHSPEAVEASVRAWLQDESPRFLARLAEVGERAEYAVQLYWHRSNVVERLLRENEVLRSFRAGLHRHGQGTRFLLERKLERAVVQEVEQQGRRCFHEVYAVLIRHCRRVRPDAVQKQAEDGWEMLMQVSCLVTPAAVQRLEQDLAAVTERHGLRYRLTGPWPPYSFT